MNITFYSSPGCKPCHEAKAILDGLGLEFEVKPIDDIRNREELLVLRGDNRASVPYLVIDRADGTRSCVSGMRANYADLVSKLLQR